MDEVSTVGLDLAKSVLQVYGADDKGAVVFRKKLRRDVRDCLTTLTCWVCCDSRYGCGQQRAVAGWPRLKRRRSVTRAT